jgi:hypothetical protein
LRFGFKDGKHIHPGPFQILPFLAMFSESREGLGDVQCQVKWTGSNSRDLSPRGGPIRASSTASVAVMPSEGSLPLTARYISKPINGRMAKDVLQEFCRDD